MNMAQHKAVELFEIRPADDNPTAGCRLGLRNTPTPGPDQVLVRVLCRAVNPSDVLAIRGHYPGWRPQSLPIVPGFEGMGVVHQVGESVSNVKVGQRVFPFSPKSDETGQGLWQEYIVVPAFSLFPIPDTVSDEVAAQFVVNPWTVYGMARVLNVPKGDYIIQSGAATVLGRMFIQYAHHEGIKTINLVRRKEQKEELKSLGGDEVIDVTHEDVVEQVKKITGGKMAYAAIDCVGGHMTKVVAQSVRDTGTVLVYGVLGASHSEVEITDLIFREIKVHGFWVTSWIKELTPHEFIQTGTHVMSLLEKKVLSPLIGEKFPLDNFKEAIKKSVEPGRGGKVFLVSY